MTGCPVVTFPVGAVDEVVETGVTGVVLSEPSATVMAEEVVRLLADADLRRSMGTAATARSSAFTWAATAPVYADRFVELVESARGLRPVEIDGSVPEATSRGDRDVRSVQIATAATPRPPLPTAGWRSWAARRRFLAACRSPGPRGRRWNVSPNVSLPPTSRGCSPTARRRRTRGARPERLGVPHVVAVSSCTSGLMLVIQALVEGRPGPVVMPSFTFMATGLAALWNNRAVRLVGSDDATFQLDVDQAADALDGASALVATHVFGAPCDPVSVERVAAAAGVPLLFDAAHAFGATTGDELHRRVRCR